MHLKQLFYNLFLAQLIESRFDLGDPLFGVFVIIFYQNRFLGEAHKSCL